MKRKTAIIIITEILWFMTAIFFWFVIWKITGITIESWKFWALLFSIIGLWLVRDIKESIQGGEKTYDCGEAVPFDKNREYNYKKMNPEKYEGLDDEIDEEVARRKELKTKGKHERIDLAMDFHIDIYRFEDKAFFEAFNGKGKRFFSTGIVRDDETFEKAVSDTKVVLGKLGEAFA